MPTRALDQAIGALLAARAIPADWTWFGVPLPGRDSAEGFARQLLIRRSTAKKQLAGGRIDFEYACFLFHHRGEAVRRPGVR
ncbi:hypothetical protein [Streptomyces sp. 4F14]|uniref:hypothetical protein n=1 Tax=Streptomyces sp. 4F14 TaxID=3394380 RepID=UPI003A852927